MSQRSLKLDAYVRVSKVGGWAGDSFISPSVQTERIEAWAKLHGAERVATPAA